MELLAKREALQQKIRTTMQLDKDAIQGIPNMEELREWSSPVLPTGVRSELANINSYRNTIVHSAPFKSPATGLDARVWPPSSVSDSGKGIRLQPIEEPQMARDLLETEDFRRCIRQAVAAELDRVVRASPINQGLSSETSSILRTRSLSSESVKDIQHDLAQIKQENACLKRAMQVLQRGFEELKQTKSIVPFEDSFRF